MNTPTAGVQCWPAAKRTFELLAPRAAMLSEGSGVPEAIVVLRVIVSRGLRVHAVVPCLGEYVYRYTYIYIYYVRPARDLPTFLRL